MTPIFSMQAIVSPGLTFIKERGMTKPLSALRRQHYQRSHVCLLHKNSTARVFPLYIFLPFSLCIFLTQRFFLLLSHFKELHNAWWNKNKRFSADEVTPRLGLLWVSLDLFTCELHSPNKAQPLKTREREIFMALPARPRFLAATHIL